VTGANAEVEAVVAVEQIVARAAEQHVVWRCAEGSAAREKLVPAVMHLKEGRALWLPVARTTPHSCRAIYRQISPSPRPVSAERNLLTSSYEVFRPARKFTGPSVMEPVT